MEVFVDGTSLGSLKVLEVYEYYDGPRLFASVNETRSVFLVLWIKFTGTTDEYYVQPMSFHRFRQVRDGEISLRDAFIGAESAGLVVLQVDRKTDEASTRHLNTAQIDQSLLPLQGEALKLKSPLPITELKMQVPSISVTYARNGSSTRANALGMRPMQERAYEKRGEQYLLIKSPPASGKSRALMFIALDKLKNQGLTQAIIAVPEKAIGASFYDEPLSKFGFWADWHVEPKWNLCNAPGSDNGGKVKAVGAFLASADKVLVCTHPTLRLS